MGVDRNNTKDIINMTVYSETTYGYGILVDVPIFNKPT